MTLYIVADDDGDDDERGDRSPRVRGEESLSKDESYRAAPGSGAPAYHTRARMHARVASVRYYTLVTPGRSRDSPPPSPRFEWLDSSSRDKSREAPLLQNAAATAITRSVILPVFFTFARRCPAISTKRDAVRRTVGNIAEYSP